MKKKARHEKIGLVLPGGGARGAYQAGVLKAFLEISQKRSQFPFKIISGTSSGAINAAFLASESHIFHHSVSHLVDLWSNFSSNKVYKTDPITMLKSSLHWFLTIISGGLLISNPKSLLDNQPLRKLLEEHIRFSNIKENQIIGKTSKSFDTSIVVIDPIDSNRNLAAAISNENIGKFILICRALKQKPSLEFFKTKKLKISNKFWNNLLVVKFEFKTRSPDIIWGQIKRATSTLSTQLELGGFTVLRSKSHTDQQKEAYLIFFLESTKIAEIYQKKGPEFFREDSTHSFISKNLKDAELVWVGNNRKIISLEKRKHTDAANFMKEFLKKNLQVGIPKGLQNDFKRGFKVFLGNKTLSKSIKEEAAELISVDGTLLHFN